jgi:hypothetical protein
MSELEPIFQAFRNWLPKEAASFGQAVARHGQLLKNIGSLAGVGSALGAIGGAGYGAREGYQDAREHGEGVGGSVLSGALHGLGSAAKGGAMGAAAGGAAGALSGKALNPSWLTDKGGIIGAGARFGQRQVHSLTGVLSPAELEGVRGGAFGARQGHEAAQKALHEAWIKDPSSVKPAVEKAVKAKKGLEAAENVQQMGLTSIPGYLSALKEHGAGKVLGASLKDQVRNMHPGMAAVALGMPAIGMLRSATAKEEPTGAGKGEQLGRHVGAALGGVAGSAMPVVGSAVVGETLGNAGGLVGKGIDRLRGRKGPPPSTLGPPPLEPAEGQHTPSERVVSPAAAGQQPDIGSIV